MASNKFLNLLHWAMCTATYRRIATAIEMATLLGAFVDCCLFACCPDGRWGNKEQVVARCWQPVASKVALDIPHRAMPSVLLRRTAVTIKMANNGGAFIFCCPFFACHNRSKRPCYGPLKFIESYKVVDYYVIS